MTYSLDGIISNAVVRSSGCAGRSGLHMILQIGYYSKNIDTVITLPLLPLLGQERVHAGQAREGTCWPGSRGYMHIYIYMNIYIYNVHIACLLKHFVWYLPLVRFRSVSLWALVPFIFIRR